MRRALSAILFVIGGWLLAGETMMAFLDAGMRARWAMPLVMLTFVGMAAVPLALATAASPGLRRRELGLTILLSAGAGIACVICVAAMLLEPAMKPFLPPMPDIRIAPLVGIANLLLLTGIGWLLYRRPGGQDAAALTG